MSGASIVALLREAYRALPNGTPQERTDYIKRRQREIEEAAPESLRSQPVALSPVKAFSQIADDPAGKRSSEEGER